MDVVDLSGNTRLPLLLDAMRRLSRAESERDLTGPFLEDMRRAYRNRGFVRLSVLGLRAGEFRILRAVGADGRDHVEPAPTWTAAPDLAPRHGGLLGRLTADGHPKVVRGLAVDHDEVLGDYFAPFRCAAALPSYRGGEIGGWVLVFDPQEGGVGERDVEEMLLSANLLGMVSENMQLARELRDANAMIRAEVEQIAHIQRTLLPRELPSVPGLQLAASFETFDHAGGDFYEIVPLRRDERGDCADPHGPWAFLMADASGHGPAAAVVAAIVHAVLHAYPGAPAGPGDVLAWLNRHLHAKRLELTFVTAFLAFFEPGTLRLRYARAGHNPPLIKQPDGALRRLDDVGSPPLGVLPDTVYEESSVVLRPGDTVLLYTDGIPETVDRAGRYFGEGGIEQAMEACRQDDAQCVIQHIRAAIRDYEGGRRPNDDQTLLAARVTG